jgi:hypothetical protein
MSREPDTARSGDPTVLLDAAAQLGAWLELE